MKYGSDPGKSCTLLSTQSTRDSGVERGVKRVNLIHFEHNVHIGEDNAIAAYAGIADSTHTGNRCTLAVQAGVVGHIEIADDVRIVGASIVSHALRDSGTYSPGTLIETCQCLDKNAMRMHQLDDMARRQKKPEQK
jgi:UDP-3-O-[3-hydroxymyristoyl] glucosamine N-acyltransferase